MLGAILNKNPVGSQLGLRSLKYKLLTEGINLEYFHASEDKQLVRNQVFLRMKFKVLTDVADFVVM